MCNPPLRFSLSSRRLGVQTSLSCAGSKAHASSSFYRGKFLKPRSAFIPLSGRIAANLPTLGKSRSEINMEDTKTKKQLHRLAMWVIAGAAMAWAGSIALHAAQTQCPADAPGDRPAPRDDNRPDGPPRGQAGRGQDDDRPRGNRPPPGPPPLQRAIDGLDLTAEQHAKVDPILSSFRQKQQQAREEFLKQMKEALTADQFAKIESAMRPPLPPRDRQDSPDERHDNRPQPPRGDRNGGDA